MADNPVGYSDILNTGSIVIGKVDIDQSNPGVTNGVYVTNLPATLDTNSGNATASTLRVAVDGTGGTGITQPTGGVGTQGWLSGIFSRLASVVLGPGTSIVGKVGIDQTTPGTTNAVAVTNLPTTVSINSGVPDAGTQRVQQAIPSSIFRVAGTSTGTVSQLGSRAIAQGAFLVNTGSAALYIGESNSITADTGLSTSGYQVAANGGQAVLFGNNTNLTFVIGSSTYAVMGA